jgi:hypothetical protein
MRGRIELGGHARDLIGEVGGVVEEGGASVGGSGENHTRAIRMFMSWFNADGPRRRLAPSRIVL